MEQFENFSIEDKLYKAPVVCLIKLTEEHPNETLLNSLSQKEILNENEKVVLIKRIVGALSFIASIVSFILIFYFKSAGDAFGDIQIFDGAAFNPMIIVMVFATFLFLILGFVLISRNKAVTPKSAFNKYMECYFNVPDVFSVNIKHLPNVAGLFLPFSRVIEKLKSFYPIVNIEIDKEEIVNFVANMTEIIEKHYADFPMEKENKDSEFIYGVTHTIKRDISKISETLMLVNGNMDILKFYSKGKKVEGNCIILNISTYFAKIGKYWMPVNPVPRFKEIIEK